jgi:hypothetical protein
VKPVIIGLVGKPQVGKTTIAKYLSSAFDYKWLRFSDGLKKMLMLGLGLLQEEVDGALKDKACEKLGGKTPRHAMRTLGTEWGRELVYPDIWVKCVEREMKVSSHTRFVIDDVRFVNELKWLQSMTDYRILMIKVVRETGREDKHVSDTQLDHFNMYDYVIANKGESLEELYKEVTRILVKENI